MDSKIKEEYFRKVKVTSGQPDVVNDRVFIDSYAKYHNSYFDFCIAGATDFAILLGADLNPSKIQNQTGQFCGNILLRSTLGHMDNYVDTVIAGTSNMGNTRIDETDGLICPVVCMPVDAVDKKSIFGNYKIENAGSYHTIAFDRLVWPQKLAEKQELLHKAFSNHMMTPTGKEYSGKMLPDGTLELLPEYEYFSKRYVKVKAERYASLPSGVSVRAGDEYWVEVSPIVWEIRNYDKLPKLNGNAIGNSTIMELRTQSGIISGIPFFPTDVQTQNANEWQNSLIRAFLNGINIHEEIRKKNGLAQKKLPQNFDFTDNGFLDQIYNMPLAAKATATTTVQKQPKTVGYGVTIATDNQKVDDQIKFYVENGKSFMIHGPRGVGKSRRIKEIDPDCVMIQLRDGILPEEIIGKTAFEQDRSVWLPPTWYTTLCDVCAKDPNHNHVLFIDEITNVRPYEQSLVFHIVLERSIDGSVGKLPDNCVVVAAGNSVFESDAAHNMPEPLYRRFNGHINLPLSVDSFVEWGCQLNNEGRPKVHPIVLAFVASNRELLNSKYDSEKPPEYAIDPRGWEQVSDIIYANDEVVRYDLIKNKIGEENAIDFCNFAKTPLITIDEILNDDIDRKKIPTDFNAQRVLCLTLRVATEEQIVPVRKFIRKYLGGEHLAFFDSIWAEGSDERTILINRLSGGSDNIELKTSSDNDSIYTE